MTNNTVHKVSIPIGNKEIEIEVGRMAKQSNGAVFAQYGETAILATACCSDKINEDYLHLIYPVE